MPICSRDGCRLKGVSYVKRVQGLLVVVLLMVGSRGAAQGLLPEDTAQRPAAEAAPPPPPPPTFVSTPAPAPLEGSIRDVTPHTRPYTLSALAYVPWWYGLGIGVKAGFEITLVPDGFIPSINDSFSLEPSFSFAYSRWNSFAGVDLNALRYTPAISALWSFHFSPRFRAYGALNLGYTIVTYTGEWADYYRDGSYFYGELSAGLFYNVSERVALRAEVGWQGLRGGLSILL
jgi:hypothetical protein